MSGGSYNYLCYAGIDSIGERRDDLEAMRDRLNELGYQRAAQGTQEVLDALDKLSSQLDRMHTAWHAVEWLDSGDYGLDNAQAELDDWEKHE